MAEINCLRSEVIRLKEQLEPTLRLQVKVKELLEKYPPTVHLRGK